MAKGLNGLYPIARLVVTVAYLAFMFNITVPSTVYLVVDLMGFLVLMHLGLSEKNHVALLASGLIIFNYLRKLPTTSCEWNSADGLSVGALLSSFL